MFKKITTSVLATLMSLIVLPTKVLAEESVGDRAWSGRPGGNGEELNRVSKGMSSLADFLIGIGLSGISKGLL